MDDGCHMDAMKDEPIFTLLARDPCAPDVVRYWMTLREAMIGRGEKPQDDHQKLDDAAKVAQDMVVWRSDATDPAKWEHGPRWTYPHAPESTFERNMETYIHVISERDDDEGPLFEILDKRLFPFGPEDKVTLLAKTLRRVFGDTRKRFNAAKQTTSDDDTRRALILSKLGVGLRQVTTDMSRPGIYGMENFIDRINGYATEAAQGVGMVTDDAIDRVMTRKVTVPEAEPVGGHQLPYDEWVKVQQSAMRVGNRFLIWQDDTEGLVFHENRNYATPEEVREDWTGYYPLRNSLQRDMIQAMYDDWKRDRDPELDVTKPANMEQTVALALAVLRKFQNGGPFTSGDARRVRGLIKVLWSDRVNAVKTDNDVTATPELPPHRFTLFEKTERWAYGRGLEINPAHIPAMLERMQDDGWLLHCVLGGVERDKFGMIFKRSAARLGKKREAMMLGKWDDREVWVGGTISSASLARLRERIAGPDGITTGLAL
jgi:hypothetical protein